MTGRVIQRAPAPSCPECGKHPMVLREPRKPNAAWDPFWGCANFPECKGTYNIDFTTGQVITDDDTGWEIDEYDLTDD